MEIKEGATYRIKGNSTYFKEKYGTPNPLIIIEAEDTKLWPNGGWGEQNGNPACICYAVRSSMLYDNLPDGKVYYGHIVGPDLGELVHETELEEMPSIFY